MRCSYQPIASASSWSDAISRAKVRASAPSSSGGSWYCSVGIAERWQKDAVVGRDYRDPSQRWRGIMNTQREGGCSCGAVRYRLASEPLFVHCCHCLNCQRQTGSAFVINLLIEADRVEVLAGDPQPVDVP